MPQQAYAAHLCPYCKEEVQPEAVRCKHCLADISAQTISHGGVCPLCKERIHPEAVRCKHCKSDLTAGGASTEAGERRLRRPPTASSTGARRIALRTKGRLADPGVDPSGCLEVIHAHGAMYCLDYVYWEIDTDETTCIYAECKLA